MNKIYRLIWLRTREMWVAVSEKVAAGWFRRPLMVGALVMSALLASGGQAQAIDPTTLPTGGQVVTGNANISQSGNAMTISQHTDKMIANWNTFNVGQNASVAFRQPGASSVALNRIFDQNPSQIYGRLSANGQVFLLNPAGVYFGPTAQVDVGGLVASSLNLSNENFLTGKYHFENTGIAGSIINQGQIRTADGGYVAFLSPRITNEGTISTPGGTVALAAGDKVSLDFTGDKLVTFTVDQGTIDALIENKGLIKADGGLVKMTAKAADELTRAVMNNSGVIEAKGLTAKGGRIILDGHEVTNSGRLDASARASDAIPNSPDGTGGAISLLGTSKVTLTGNATLDASGDSGGGSIIIGGNYRGKGPEPNAKETYVGDNVKITADAITSGDGGRVIVWADDKTIFNGGISARGGALGGDGGFVETSGHKLKIGETAFVDTRAPFGITGSWLLDPNNITIAAAGGDFTGAQVTGWLGSSDVIITTSDMDNGYSTDGGSSYTPAGSAGDGDIFVNDSITWSSHKLTLDAWRNIKINRELFGSAAAQLALYYGQGAVNAGNTATYKVSAPVNLGAGNNFSTKLGHDVSETAYTVITSLGAADSVTGTDLQGINGNKGGNYALGANIDASSTSGWNGGAGFLPIGTSASQFTGQLDGLGHAITGLYINRPESDAATGGYNIGLFGSTDYVAKIRNTGLIGGQASGFEYVGGLVGWNRGTIEYSYATGTVSSPSSSVGGLVGRNNGPISNSYATGAVSSYNIAGGLVGVNNFATISNSYATGAVSGNKYVGGLVGCNYNTDKKIEYSYATGSVTGNYCVGGLVGKNDGGTISNSYWDTETSGQATSDGGTGLTTAQMMQRANFTGFDFDAVWYLPDNFQGNTRPFLRSEYSTTIGNAHQLQLMDMDKGASYTLANNIDMSELKQAAGMWGGTGASANKGFVPVGNDTNKFTGQFNGQGFTVTGLYIYRPGTDYAGLFGYTDGAAISNAGITGGSVTGHDYVGGLAGYNNSSAIENSYATGVVTGNDYVGGLAGMNNGTISNSYATGTVSGTSYVGGLAGYNSSTIEYSYATGTVSGTNYAGGFVGYDDGGSSSYTANFWDTETSGTTLGVGSGNLDNVTGRATSAMMTRKNFTDAGWLFNADNWGMYSAGSDVNISYPYLSKRFPAAPQIVSGTLTGDGVAGKTVRLAKGGVDYGPSSAGANRFYYFAVDSGSIAEADPYLLYISDSAVKGGAVYKYNGPRNLDSVLSYTWEQKRGGPSG